jgi:hypothetical protein
VELFQQKPMTSKVVVASDKAVLICFTRELLETYFNNNTINEWLQNHITVKFVDEYEVLKQSYVEKKIKDITVTIIYILNSSFYREKHS